MSSLLFIPRGIALWYEMVWYDIELYDDRHRKQQEVVASAPYRFLCHHRLAFSRCRCHPTATDMMMQMMMCWWFYDDMTHYDMVWVDDENSFLCEVGTGGGSEVCRKFLIKREFFYPLPIAQITMIWDWKYGECWCIYCMSSGAAVKKKKPGVFWQEGASASDFLLLPLFNLSRGRNPTCMRASPAPPIHSGRI